MLTASLTLTGRSRAARPGRQCLTDGLATGDGPDSVDLKRLEKVFLSLA